MLFSRVRYFYLVEIGYLALRRTRFVERAELLVCNVVPLRTGIEAGISVHIQWTLALIGNMLHFAIRTTREHPVWSHIASLGNVGGAMWCEVHYEPP